MSLEWRIRPIMNSGIIAKQTTQEIAPKNSMLYFVVIAYAVKATVTRHVAQPAIITRSRGYWAVSAPTM